MKTLYWQWHGFYLHATFWQQSCRVHDRRRVLSLHDEVFC